MGTAWSMVHLQEEKPLRKPSVHICVANTLGDPRHRGSAVQVGVCMGKPLGRTQPLLIIL